MLNFLWPNKRKVELPNEIWCHILNFVTRPRDIISCKRVSKLFYGESSKKIILSHLGVKWDQNVTSYFASRPMHPCATQRQIKQFWLSRLTKRLVDYRSGDEYLYLVKTVIVGPYRCKVGKSTIKRTLQYDCYNDYDTSTDFVVRRVTSKDGVPVNLQIWDTCWYFPRQPMLKRTNAVLLCFAIDDRSTFIKLFEETLVQCFNSLNVMEHPEFYLVGLKADLAQDRAVSVDEAEAVAGELHMKYFEVSCKQYPRGNVNEMLQEIGEDELARMTGLKLQELEQELKPSTARMIGRTSNEASKTSPRSNKFFVSKIMDGITKHESSAPELPTEIWCHILNLITNFRDLISCKRISRQLYSIIKYEKAISNVLGVQLDEEIAAYFTNNKTYPRATKEEIKQYWISCPPEERKSNIDGEYLFLVKTVIVGPSKVKKSALRRTIAQGSYSEDEPYLGSIRVREEFVIVQKLITNSDGVSAKLQIWDTYHAERFKRLILTSYFRGASVVLLCFSVNDRSSLIELLEETLAQCYEHRMRLDHAQFYLVGLKDDLTTDNVSYDEAQWVASELHMKYFEVSCKQYPRGNLNEMLQEIGEDALARMTWSKLHEDNEKPKEKVGSESYSRSNQSRSGLALVISSAVVLVAVAIANLW